ncbi:MAG: NTP transferase domain-containing protein [Candidatus Nomurabacteria bacterium]|nr:NTP transferase domain-containing protein [Candidatus Nomurabacteria bacterium]
MHDKLKIIILAAGKGTRMKMDEPKALAMFKGKPFIEHILETIKKLDPKIKPIIVIGYKKEQIKKVLGDEHIYAEQTEQLGTGHAVMSAKNVVGEDHEIVLVISVDQPLVSKETLKRIITVHTKEKPTITLATVTVPDFEEWRVGLNHFGRIVRGGNGLIKGIVEFKDANVEERKIKELNPALYAFDAKWLWDNIKKIKNENTQAEYYLTDLIKIATEQKKKIETVQMENIIEALQPNCKEELEILTKIVS